MKDAEDEAFDELAKRQGDWGGGFKAKRKMAADKLQEPEREALKLALEALDDMHIVDFPLEDLRNWNKAITAIKEALAQPAQEPVAWMTINAYGDEDDIWYENPEGKLLEGWTYKPLYTYPPTVQLEKEPLEYWNAVEGWVKIDEVREHFDSVGCGTIYKTAGEDRVPVYTTSQKREWVDLSDSQIEQVYFDSVKRHRGAAMPWGQIQFGRALQALIKEKNTYDPKKL